MVYPHWRVCRTGWFRRVSSLAVSRFGVCFCVLVSGDKSSMAGDTISVRMVELGGDGAVDARSGDFISGRWRLL